MARFDLSDFEWSVIQPLLPNKPRGVPRVDDRRVLNGIFWRLRTGAPWADIPDRYGPHTTCVNRFNRWRRAGVWDRILQGVSAAYEGDIQMIDLSSIRVHQHAANAKKKTTDPVAYGPRSRGGLTTKIHAMVDANGLPIGLKLTEGQAHDGRSAEDMLGTLEAGSTSCWRIGPTTATNCARPSPIGEPGPTSNPCPTAPTSPPSAVSCIATGTASNGSSTRSNTTGVSQPDTTRTPKTTSPASSSPQPEFGCARMSHGLERELFIRNHIQS